MNPTASRRRGLAAALAGAGALAVALATMLAAPAASASTVKDEHKPGMSVTVPPASPTPTPTPPGNNPPPNNPPGNNPPPNDPPPNDPPPNNTPGGQPGGNGSRSGGSGGAGSAGSAGAPASTDAGTTTPATEPAITARPASSGEEAKVDKDFYSVGGTVTVTAEGFTAGEQVQVVVYSDPVLIGNVAASDDGTFTHTFALPDELAPGTHTVQLTGWESKRIALATFLITGEPLAAADQGGLTGIPPWIWWVAGALALVLLVFGGWWIVRVMRAPAAEAAPA